MNKTQIKSTVASRLTALTLAVLLASPAHLFAEPYDSATAAATPPTPANPVTPPVSPTGIKEPLIEVSVDSLEISEVNRNSLGFLWGDDINATGSSLHFLERNSVPSILNIGPFDRVRIQAQLDALIVNNQARVLANPTLLTKSGFEANFAVGGEIPYPTVGQGGVSGVEFKKYGVTLKILPQITPRKTIDAQINVGVSNPDDSVARRIGGSPDAIPGLATRDAGTKVEVNDGETVVLAGIKQSVRTKEIQRVPILGYIPILGLLFRHKAERVQQVSLVIFVTFRFVKDKQAS